MAGVDATDLHELALEFLSACEDALDTIPNSAPGYGGSPARSFVSPGTPAIDCCDQLAVSVGPITQSAQDTRLPASAKAAWINHVVLLATISRCVPVWDGQTPPTPAAQQDAAAQINYDKWALWNHLHFLVNEGLLFSRCGDVVWVGLTPLTPSGGCGGSLLTVRVSLDGYEEVLGT
jgi:hypothetical protein